MTAPEHKLRIGSETIPIFRNDGDHGPYLVAKIEGRRYQDEQQQWQSTHGYNATQLAAHIALCQSVLHYMITEAPEID